MNRFAILLTSLLTLALCGCSFVPKRDMTQLHIGNSRAQIHSVLGKPAASYRHQGHDVDVYAFFQGYSQAQQTMIASGKVIVESGKVMAVLGGVALVLVAEGMLEEQLNDIHDSPDDERTAQARKEYRKREEEDDERRRKEELREQREAEALAMYENHFNRQIMWEEKKLQPEDLDPKFRTELHGKTLHFDNHVDADCSRHLVFAVNYDADQKLTSVAFLTGMTKASGDAFGRGPETWFKKRGKFPLQDVRQSIFFAPPEEMELQEQVMPLPPLE